MLILFSQASEGIERGDAAATDAMFSYFAAQRVLEPGHLPAVKAHASFQDGERGNQRRTREQ
jgi:hypothetical protein